MPGIESSGPATTPGNNLAIAIATLGPAGGTVIVPPGTWVWESVPALPKNITGQLRIIGAPGATIQLTAAAPRFLDFNRTADYDTFQNIEVRDFIIDANSIGGKHHVILGTYVNGANQQRVNIQSLTLRNIRAVNVLRDPNTGTNHRLGVWIMTADPGGGSATTLNDILCENVRIEGGNAGIGVGSASSTAITSCDRVTFRSCYHDTGTVPTASFSSSNYQIGGYASSGQAVIEACYGANSGDVGVEIDNAISASVRDCEIIDSWNAGLFLCNFTAAPGQSVRFLDCLTKKVNIGAAATSANGIRLGGNAADNKIGSVTIQGCEHVNTSQSLVQGDALSVSETHPTGGYERIILRNCKAYIAGFNQDVTTITNAWAYVIGAPSGTSLIDEIDGLYAEYSIVRGGGSTQALFYGTLAFTGTGTFSHKIQGVSGSSAQTNEVSTSAQLVCMNISGGTNATHRGELRLIGPVYGSANGQIGVRFQSGQTYQHLDISECDLSNAAGGNEFSFPTATDKGLVHIRGTRYRNGTPPVPTNFTGLVTATGKRLDTGWDAFAIFTQGSGSAITAIDVSANTGTTYTNVLTQGSGAMPAGAALVVGPLTSDSLIKATFTTTQPTITLVPVNP